MPKTPKEDSKELERPDASTDEDRCGENQKEPSYYYDDAHGYEDFDPEEADEEDESDEAQGVSGR